MKPLEITIDSKLKLFILLVQNIPTNWYVFLFKNKLANWLDRDIAVSTIGKGGKVSKAISI